MELTKKNIDEIEARLIKSGVKFWDLRVEMLDHIVTDVEERLKKNEPYEKAVINSMIYLGYNGSFHKVIEKKQNQQAKYMRSLLFAEIKGFFTSGKTLLLYLVVMLFFYSTKDSKMWDSFMKSFIAISAGCFFLFALYKYKYVFRSISLSVFIINCIACVNILNFRGAWNYSNLKYNQILYLILFPLLYCSFKLFLRNYRKYTEMYAKIKRR